MISGYKLLMSNTILLIAMMMAVLYRDVLGMGTRLEVILLTLIAIDLIVLVVTVLWVDDDEYER